MDKNEQMLKMEELRSAVLKRELDKAVEIADSLDLRKIKDNTFLSIVAEAYEKTKNYEDAKEALLLAYENTNAGRLIAYKLCLLSIKTKSFEDAQNYYEDFVDMAPRDTTRYILKYRMAKAQNKPLEELIAILEEYVNIDMEEKWAYELAKLYSAVGEKEKCIDICDEISLWFAEGKYVNKAIALKKKYSNLTATQQEKYEESLKEKELKEQKEHQIKDITEDVIKENIEVDFKETEQENFAEKKRKRRPFEINPDMIKGTIPNIKIEEPIKENLEGEHDITVAKHQGDMEEIVLEEDSEDEVPETETEQKADKPDDEQDVIKEDKKDIEDNTELKQQDSGSSAIDETIHDVHDVSDILKQLQARGILKAETVQQAVSIIDGEGTNSYNRESNTDEVSESKKSEEPHADSDKKKNNNTDIPAVDESDIVYEEDLIAEEPDKEDISELGKNHETDNNMTDSDELGSTKIFNGAIVPDGQDGIDSQSTKTINTSENVNEEPIVQNESVPMLDLEFDTPKRDVSKDIGQKNMYENIAANSDLGYKTDKLPTREELQAAIKKAEEVVAKKGNEDSVESLEVQPKENPTSKIEVIAGAGIVEEGEIDIQKTSEKSIPNVVISKEETRENSNETVLDEKQHTEERSDINLPVADDTQQGKDKKDDSLQDNDASDKNTEELQAAAKEDKKALETTDQSAEKSDSGEKYEEVSNAELKELREGVLSEAELTEFKNYLNVEGFESNIREVLQELIVNFVPNGRSDEGNVIIMGNEKTGKTTLAIEMIKLVNRKRGRRNRRLAKVDATALNRKGFRYAVRKLVGSDLIIENADKLGKMTVSEIIDVSGMFTDDMLIVLEGDMEGMETLIKESPRLEQVFNHVVRIKEYDIKEWVEYGIKYALGKGYKVDELANLAFYKSIDDFFGANKGIGQSDVESIIDNAIEKSGRFGRKVKGIFGSNTDEDGLMILEESDFDI
jgi:hypothetical protein